MASLRSAPAVQISRSTLVMLPGAFAAADFRADLQSLAAMMSQPREQTGSNELSSLGETDQGGTWCAK